MNLSIPLPARAADLIKILLFATICLVTALVGMFFALNASRISLVWPLTGVSVAVVLLHGRKYAVGVFVAMVLNTLTLGMALPLALAVACGSSALALFSASMLKESLGFRFAFDRVRDVINFVIIGVILSPMISAVVGTTAFMLGGLVAPNNYVLNLFTWWVGDAVGVLVIAPVIIIWTQQPFRKPAPRKLVESVILVVLLLTVAWLIFGQGFGARSFYPLAYLIFPFLIWGALRFDQRMVATLTLLVSLVAVIQTSRSFGTFSHQMVWTSVLFLWAYMATMTVTTMLLSATLAENRRNEQNARAQEKRFSSAFHSAPVAFWLAELKSGKLVDVNDEFCVVMGYRREQAIGKTSLELKMWESVDARAEVEAQLLKSGQISQLETRLRSSSGAVRSGLLSAELMDVDGEPHMLEMFHDLTARVKAEDALRLNEERYRQLFEGIDDAVFIHDLEANILDVNEAACRRLGYSREELLGMKVTALDAPGFAEGFQDRLRQQLEAGFLDRIEGVQVAKDGRMIYLDINTKVITYRGRQAILAVDRDITQRKQAEAQLRASEARYRAIVEDQTEMISRLTPDGKLTFVNDAFCNYHRKTREELLNKPFAAKIHPEDLARVEQLVRGLSAENPVATSEYRIIYDDGSAAGSVRWHEWTHRAILSEQGEIVEYQFVGKDTTLLKESEQQRMVATLEREKVRILGEFIASASHDFRTPLSVINTSAYLLSRISDEAQRKHHLNQIQEQTYHIEHLIDGLLTMSRLDRGDVFRFKPVNLNPIIQQIDMHHRVKVEEKALTLRVELAPDLPKIEADSGWIHTAVMQLLDNAMRFTPAGGTIRMQTCLEKDRAVITVSDTGSGISPEDLPHIFKRLYRGEEHRPVGGQGLGLSMVARIVEAHQGSIEVESEPGTGSTFRLLLPIKRVDTNAVPLHSP